MTFLKKHWPIFAAVLSGICLALCFEPWNVSSLIWFWQAPLLAALWFAKPNKEKTPRWRWGLGLGYLTGLAFFLTSQTWFIEVQHVAGNLATGIVAWIGMCAYLAIYPALFGAFAATVGRWVPREPKESQPLKKKNPRFKQPFPTKGKGDLFDQSFHVLKYAFLNGAAWCGLEWLRGIAFTGFAWNGLGVALKDHLMLVQFADVIGVDGYGFVLMFSGCIAFCTVVRLVREIQERKRLRPHLDFAFGVALVMGLFLYGMGKITDRPKETVEIRARILQMKVSMEDKWSEDKKLLQKIIFDYRDLTRAFVETADYDLVLWPETALPGYFSFPWMQDLLNDQILKGDSFYLLTGLEDHNFSTSEIYNTITLMKGSTESYQSHRKIHLAPFGEYIPLRNSFPPFEWILGAIIAQDFIPGESYEPLVIEKDGQEIGIIPSICIEDTLGRHTRKFVREGPQLIVNVTNDAWFYESAEPAQHFANALFRCIEIRRPMARAANTGVSGFIDERGSVYDRNSSDSFARIIQDEETGDTYIRGSLPATLQIDLNPPITFYARFGNLFSVTLGAIALFFSVVQAIKTRKRKAGQAPLKA